MESISPEKSEKKPQHCNSNEEKYKAKLYYEHEKEIFDFLSSKFETMEKMNLNDECPFEDELKSKKININKNVVPKTKESKSKKRKQKSPQKKSESKNKNIIVKSNGNVKKMKIESIDLIDVDNIDIEHEMKKKDSSSFFSNKTLLSSIINEIKGK